MNPQIFNKIILELACFRIADIHGGDYTIKDLLLFDDVSFDDISCEMNRILEEIQIENDHPLSTDKEYIAMILGLPVEEFEE